MLDAIATNGMKEAGYKYVNIGESSVLYRRLIGRTLCEHRGFKHNDLVGSNHMANCMPRRACSRPDDCWQVERFLNGTIQPDPARFPSGMKALADYAHSKGLKFGVYTARGSRTCQNRPGAYNHELIDAKTYCDCK